MLSEIKAKWKNNSKVLENYSFMTLLQASGMIIGVIIYPYLIRTLGASCYGLYVFSLSICNYFIYFVSFGFQLPITNLLVLNKKNADKESEIFSSVIIAKIYLSIFTLIVFIVLLFTVRFISSHKFLFLICFMQIISEILSPIWYYQATQKMKVITCINLFFRILGVIFILFLIHNPNDIIKYALITSLSVICSGIVSFSYVIVIDKIKFQYIPFRNLQMFFSEAVPFFWSSFWGIIKQESVTLIIGSFFSMKDVALYDLANKIVLIPRMITNNINAAIFPKVISLYDKLLVKRIIKSQYLLGSVIIVIIFFFGKWAVLLLGGQTMVDAYPMAVILSFTIISWMVVGCYINFVFIPIKKTMYVNRNQFIALVVFILIALPGVLILKNSLMLVIALTVSGLVEIIYCHHIINNKKML